MNYSHYNTTPRFIEKLPLYSNIQICPTCGSNDSCPLMNMVGSVRYCNNKKCMNMFNPQLSGISHKKLTNN